MFTHVLDVRRAPMSALFAFLIAFRASEVFAVSASPQAGGRADIDARLRELTRKGFAGQVLVAHDALGLTPDPAPSFVKRYAHLSEEIVNAAQTYADEVRKGKFPQR